MRSRRGWKVTLLNYNETELGGVKEADFEIDGDGAYSRLKFESGVHRVQRVPGDGIRRPRAYLDGDGRRASRDGGG